MTFLQTLGPGSTLIAPAYLQDVYKRQIAGNTPPATSIPCIAHVGIELITPSTSVGASILARKIGIAVRKNVSISGYTEALRVTAA